MTLAMQTPYTAAIQALAPNHAPDQVEAYLRLEFGTLDHLPPDQFRREVDFAVMCIDADPEQARRLAATY